MIIEKWLVCGTRRKGYEQLVFDKLDGMCARHKDFNGGLDLTIVEGCCPDSADAYAEKWAEKNGVKILHHPGEPGTYLKRNVEMVEKVNLVIAFWDGWSYGTAHTIAQAIMNHKEVVVVKL